MIERPYQESCELAWLKAVAIGKVPLNNQKLRTCHKCHAFYLRKRRATFDTPLI